ncbi:MAG: M48 family metallopeptidase [Planctomycetaceae bacterium]
MDLGLFQHIDHNRRRSVLLVVVAVLFLGVVGGVLGAATTGVPWAGIAVAVGVGAIFALIAWQGGSSLVLSAAGAREIGNEEDTQLVNVVEELCLASGLPRPKIYLIDDPSPNAFAAGMEPRKAAVAITTGLRDRLTREELQGVMAHEMAHIGNFDTRVMVLMASLVGSIAILSDMFLRGMRFRRVHGGRGGKGQGVMLLIALLLSILAPIIAVLIQFAVSRRREYLADATGAAMTRNPGALADALEKLSHPGSPLRLANRGTQHLFIVNPIHPRQALDTPFASHPPLEERIRRLRRLAGQLEAQS